MTNIVYAVFGNKLDYHNQVQFSILSLLAQKKKNITFYVLTDHVEYYKNIQNSIQLIEVTNDTLKEWKGPHDFFWRIKIKSIQLIAHKHPDCSIIYLDGDTVFYSNIDHMLNKLATGTFYMHKKEATLSTSKSGTHQKMYTCLKGKIINNTYPINPETSMWNAGVIGIPASNTKIIDEILAINDELLDTNVIPKLVEQLSFSICLSKHQLIPADKTIIHYWATKNEWNQVITSFQLTCAMKNYTIEEKMDTFNTIPIHTIPIHKRVPTWNRRLTQYIHKIFPTKHLKYIE